MVSTSPSQIGNAPPTSIMINNQDGLYVVLLDEVIRLEAFRNYTTFHFISRASVTVAKTLKDFERILPSSMFFRIHKSHIINYKHIHKLLKREGGFLEMIDKSLVPLSRYKKKEFMAYQKSRAVYIS